MLDIPYKIEDRGHDTPCWICTLSTNEKGYARVQGRGMARGQQVRAHRWSYEKFYGNIPSGKEIDHLCRQRACINPLHLEPVTRHQNVARSSSCVLTSKDIEEMREMRAEGHTFPDIASRFGVSSGYAGQLVRGNRVRKVA